jgi:hypothetical protein
MDNERIKITALQKDAVLKVDIFESGKDFDMDNGRMSRSSIQRNRGQNNVTGQVSDTSETGMPAT